MVFGNFLGESHVIFGGADLSRMCSDTSSPCSPNPSDRDEPGAIPCKFQLHNQAWLEHEGFWTCHQLCRLYSFKLHFLPKKIPRDSKSLLFFFNQGRILPEIEMQNRNTNKAN